MFLHKIHLDPRCKEARRDLTDPYQMHATLCRAFSEPDRKCDIGAFLWRLEPEADRTGNPRILVQSHSPPDWSRIGIKGWLAEEPGPGIDLEEKLGLAALENGRRFRYRLRANPCVTRQGKRFGLVELDKQIAWLERKGMEEAGFSLPHIPAFDIGESESVSADVQVSQEQKLRGRQHSGNELFVFSVLYDGILAVDDPVKFRKALHSGIGHGKSMGLGLLSVAPLP
ncbi:MAG TPA: type I-E CRISPR-associated protein Cas6/Cse3/CasE [Rectinemataceae bacterium]|nr:type I-E CRISPR-associated protein Cas6/Cse3/CasE [Rectinemataceae bacterium]